MSLTDKQPNRKMKANEHRVLMHITTTDLYKYPPDAVPPIQYVLSHK